MRQIVSALILSGLLVGFAAVPGHAKAQEPVVTVNALNCIPQSSSGAASGSDGTYSQNAFGQVILYCPITHVTPNADVFELVYRDTDGWTSRAHVNAYLYRVGDLDGTSTLIASLDSHTSNVMTMNRINTSFAHTFDLTESSYYVIVQLTSSGYPAQFRAVRIFDSN